LEPANNHESEAKMSALDELRKLREQHIIGLLSYKEELMIQALFDLDARISEFKRVYGERLDDHRQEIDLIKFPLD
jgi:hypothetical protein